MGRTSFRLLLSSTGTQQHQHLAFLASRGSNKLGLGALPTEINVFKPLAVIKKDFIIVIYIYMTGAIPDRKKAYDKLSVIMVCLREAKYLLNRDCRICSIRFYLPKSIRLKKNRY